MITISNDDSPPPPEPVGLGVVIVTIGCENGGGGGGGDDGADDGAGHMPTEIAAFGGRHTRLLSAKYLGQAKRLDSSRWW